MSQNPNLSRDSDYYAARAVEERRLAMACSDAKARAIHLELAEKYAEIAETGRSATHEVIGEGQRTG
jgi:hypothetical protein